MKKPPPLNRHLIKTSPIEENDYEAEQEYFGVGLYTSDDLEDLLNANPVLNNLVPEYSKRRPYYDNAASQLVIARKSWYNPLIALVAKSPTEFLRCRSNDRKTINGIATGTMNFHGFPHECLDIQGIRIFMNDNGVPEIHFFCWLTAGFFEKGRLLGDEEEIYLINPRTRRYFFGKGMSDAYIDAWNLWGRL